MFSKELEIARKAALEAGKVLEGLFGHLKKIEKKDEIDLVTEADLQSEKTIVDLIKTHFPQDNILTEEGSGQSRDNDRVWIIDPLDGTTNFAHSFPFFAISIGLEIKKEMVLGVVFNPHMHEFFEAVRGQGAFLNQKPIQVSNCAGLRDALVATGFPYDIHHHSKKIMARFEKVMSQAQGVRRPGAASIDLCYVAAGRLDGFWEEKLKPWDTAAGSLIVQEAGGRVGNFQGQPYSPYHPSIIAGNPAMFEALVGLLGS